MLTAFKIVAEKLLLFLNELNEMEMNDEFFTKVKMYENFLKQLLQITDKMDSIDDEGKEILNEINEKNALLLKRLEEEQSKIKQEIVKTNKKENIKKKYYN